MVHKKAVAANILATIFCFALLICAPAQAQIWRSTGLPDPVEFGVRIEMGDIAQARSWLDQGLDPNFVGDRIGTGLMIAAWEGNLPLMELFVKKGAEIDRINALGETALMHAAWKGRMDAVQWLLARGAKLNRGPRQWTALHYAAFSGQEQVVQHLVERGADLDARSTNGSTPLMMAVYEGREPVVKQLIRLGADRRVRNDYGDGAMDWAFKHNHVSIARLVGTMEEFTAAANRPKAYWPETPRSQPVTATSQVAQARSSASRKEPSPEMHAELEDLMRVRASLVAKGRNRDVHLLDRKISVLRFKLAKPGEDYRRPAIVEISASRNAPGEQKTRLMVAP